MTKKTAGAEYDADSLVSLSPIMHIRKRPSLSLGPYQSMKSVALREPIDNSIDEYRAGHGKKVKVTIFEDGSARIEDAGRGVPTGINKTTGENGIFMAFGKVGSGGKFGAADSGYSGGALGLNGVGTTATNATSARFDTIVYRDGKKHRLSFKEGSPGHWDADNGPKDKFTPGNDIKVSKDDRTTAEKKARPTGTTIHFWPDETIFGPLSTYRINDLRESLRSTAFLVPGICIEVDDRLGETEILEPEEDRRPAVEPQHDVYEFDGGLSEMIDLIAPDPKLHDTINTNVEGSFTERVPVPQEDGTVKMTEVKRTVDIDLALRWGTGYEYTLKSFVNTINTSQHGTHVTGMERAISKAFIDNIKGTRGLLKAKEEPPILDDVREGLTAIISISLAEPSFTEQSKSRLGSTHAQKVVNTQLTEWMAQWMGNKKNAATLKIIQQKIVEAARIRLAQREQKQLARKKSALETSQSMPAKLVSCNSSDPEITELQLCEGISALGGLRNSRSSSFQAIYPLRGKPLNTYGLTLSRILENAEMSDMVQIIGAGIGKSFDLSAMRYKRIILLADGDADGGHIAVLLCAFFWKFMRPLVEDGRLFVAMPPLFSITTTGRNRERFYALNQEELDKLQKKLKSQGKKYERIQRHKGLGEYSPEILAEVVMDPETRTLKQITTDDAEAIIRVMDLTMGKDAEGRRDWIVENRSLISDEDIDA